MANIIRVRRVDSSWPFRKYELELPPLEEPGSVEHLVTSRGIAIRRLEPYFDIREAYTFVAAADREWAEGNHGWAVEFDWRD